MKPLARNVSVFLSLVVTCLISSVIVEPVSGQETLSADEWIEDIRFLQQTARDDYASLFRKVTVSEFDQAADELVGAVPTLQQHEIVVGIARLVSLFQYGHTRAVISEGPVAHHRLRIWPYQFSDGMYIQGVHREHEDLLGAKIVAIEGVPIDEVMARVRPVVPAENDQFMKAHGPSFLCIPEILHAQKVMPELKNQIVLTLEKNERTFTKSIEAHPTDSLPPAQHGFAQQSDEWLDARDQTATPLFLKHLSERVYFFEHLPEQKAVYVRHSAIRDDPRESIPDFYDRLFQFIESNDVETLILDVRLNGGGNNYKNKAIVTGLMECRQINQTGKLFVIIGRRTFSACQNLVNEIHNYTNAVFVGEPTSENVNFMGDVNQIVLPNSKIPVRLSFAWWQDKPQWENGPWLAPHLAVEMSFEDYVNNRDPVLDVVLDSKGSDLVVDPYEYLKQLFMDGEKEKVQTEAKRLAADPRYRYFEIEDQINRAAYDLLNGGRTSDANFLFELITELYPQSQNAWDSLAEGRWRAGRVEEAIQTYEKAIAMDPQSSIAENARAKLQQIKEANKDSPNE